MGDSAGAHLTALVALAGDEPLFSTEYRSDPHVATAANVKSVIGFYGVYDMQAQWLHDQITRPRDQISEKFLGASPMQNRRIYFDASPTSYATVEKNEKTRTRFLLIHGTNDDIVDPQTQSQVFLTALKQAGFFARSIVVPGSDISGRASRRGAGKLRCPGSPADAALSARRAVTGEGRFGAGVAENLMRDVIEFVLGNFTLTFFVGASSRRLLRFGTRIGRAAPP
jgi:acetyl esterase/lipase